MRFAVAILTQSDKLKQQLVPDVGVGMVVDMLDWFRHASLAHLVPSDHQFPQTPPLRRFQILGVSGAIVWLVRIH